MWAAPGGSGLQSSEAIDWLHDSLDQGFVIDEPVPLPVRQLDQAYGCILTVSFSIQAGTSVSCRFMPLRRLILRIHYSDDEL